MDLKTFQFLLGKHNKVKPKTNVLFLVLITLVLLASEVAGSIGRKRFSRTRSHQSSESLNIMDYRFLRKIREPCGGPIEILGRVTMEEVNTVVNVVDSELNDTRYHSVSILIHTSFPLSASLL